MAAFFSVFFVLLIMSVLMWGFFRFMYPKPPKAFMPKAGDVITPRECSLCGYPLAEYRGVLEAKPESALDESQQAEIAQLNAEIAQLQQAVAESEKVLYPNANDKANASHNGKVNACVNANAAQADLKTMSRKQKKQLKQAYEQQKQQLFDKQQALKQLTTWFFCNYEHQAEFHAQQSSGSSLNSQNTTNES
ncbi:hypothetical protein [Psychrobacter lutiphocae]|uniref:hypothetical protein n=1 Tax=Psychrobacter lutiphocae TaxID=540500 RepID=UPI000366DFCC|nr:hypothetical protein [Psychrobacter lutiphocae]